MNEYTTATLLCCYTMNISNLNLNISWFSSYLSSHHILVRARTGYKPSENRRALRFSEDLYPALFGY